jgi:hypothetical protein
MVDYTPQSTHRVATAAFWRTFQYDGKFAQAGEGIGGVRPPPFTIFTIMYKVAVYAPAERADRRVHRVSTAAFWRTFSDEGKISPGW